MTQKDIAQSSFAAPAGSAASFKSRISGMEAEVDKLRDAAYRAKRYRLAGALQDVKRSLFKIRAVEHQTQNDKLSHGG